MIWLLQPLVATAVSLGEEMSVDHEPGHSNGLADGLYRAKPETLAQLDSTKRVEANALTLLRRGRNWHVYPPNTDWPDHLLTG